MIYSLIFLTAMILAPLLMQSLGCRPATLFFVVAAVYAVFGITSFATLQIVLSQSQQSEPTHKNYYYMVSHGYFLLNMCIAMAVVGAIIWVQTRFGAMRYPKLTKILFWVLHVALIGSTSFKGALALVLSEPRRFAENWEFIQTQTLVSSWFGLLGQFAMLGLFCMLLWSILLKWLRQ